MKGQNLKVDAGARVPSVPHFCAQLPHVLMEEEIAASWTVVRGDGRVQGSSHTDES